MALYDEYLRKYISGLPKSPGIYQYLNSKGEIIYIGKAKNLHARVSSYLHKKGQSRKTLKLLDTVSEIRYAVVENAEDALLLENNLIKKYRPKYNILLKDDKTYPWICIKDEVFPRVFITRRLDRKKGVFFGPYTSVRFASTLIKLIRLIYKIRTCSAHFSKSSIQAGKHKVCLQYHIGNCKAPCVGKISEEEYEEDIIQIKNILKGNISSVIDYMKNKMSDYAEKLEYEKAAEVKEAIDIVRNHQTKSAIVAPALTNIDIFSYEEGEKYVYVNFMKVVNGAVNQIHTIEMEKRTDEEKASVFSFAIFEIRQLVNSSSREIVLPFYPDIMFEGVRYTIPQKGEKKKLLELSLRNLKYFKADKEKSRAGKFKEKSKENINEILRRELNLKYPPSRIECFDNSNISGTHPVAACVVFENGKPLKREYRHFHVKTVKGPDDYASIREIVFRRYKRVLEENGELPGLIVIDGGKGQLRAATEAMNALDLKLPVIGLAERLEEIYYPGDKEPYILGKNSSALKLLMYIRDEAHRFGISFHRSLREKDLIKGSLSGIKGIGRLTEERLISHFGSVERMRISSQEEIAEIIGPAKAALIWNYLTDK